MSTMKIILLIVAGSLASSIFGADEPIRGGASMPRKELLRPIILPKGGWQNSLRDQLYVYNFNSSEKYKFQYFSEVRNFIRGARSKFQYYNCVFSLFPRFAVSDRVEFGAFPLPYVAVLMTDADIGYSADGTLNRFAMTIDGGFTGLTITEITNVTLNFAVGINTKLLLSDRWWHEQHFRASYISIFQDFLLTEIAGLQCTDIIAIKMGISGGMNWMAYAVSVTSFAAGGEVHLVANLSRWVSIAVSGSGNAVRTAHFQGNIFYGSVGSTFIVQW